MVDSYDFGVVVRVGGPFAGEVLDVGGAAAGDFGEAGIDEGAVQTARARVGFEVLDLGTDAEARACEGIARGAVAGGADTGEVVLLPANVPAEAQVVRFQAHLAEGHVVIDAFDAGLVDVEFRQ